MKNRRSHISAKRAFFILLLGVLAILDVLGSILFPILGKATVNRPLEVDEKGVCRGAKPLCWESEGIPQIQSIPPSWPGRGKGGWSKGFFSTLLEVN